MWVWHDPAVDFADGVQAPDEPEQYAIDAPSYTLGDWTIEPLASYRFEAVILHTYRYRFDRIADLSPIDLAIGWGPMSDGTNLNTARFSQGHRFYNYRYDGSTGQKNMFALHSANVHAVPANAEIRKQLLRLKPGQLVRLSGQLVAAQNTDGQAVRSSLRRDDSGAGACELMVVEQLHID